MDDIGCLIAVPLTSSSSKLSTFAKFSGTFSSFEQPESFRVLRDFKPLMIHESLTQVCCSHSNSIKQVQSEFQLIMAALQ